MLVLNLLISKPKTLIGGAVLFLLCSPPAIASAVQIAAASLVFILESPYNFPLAQEGENVVLGVVFLAFGGLLCAEVWAIHQVILWARREWPFTRRIRTFLSKSRAEQVIMTSLALAMMYVGVAIAVDEDQGSAWSSGAPTVTGILFILFVFAGFVALVGWLSRKAAEIVIPDSVFRS